MMPRTGRLQSRPAATPKENVQRLLRKTLPAPVRGWVANENLAMAEPAGAMVLENWFPTSEGIRVRGGSQKYATIGTDPVLRMWVYRSGSAEQFFASDAENIFPITTVVDADTPPTADVTGQTSGYYCVQQFGTAGGNYLYAVNGTDDAQLYDGATWTAINGLSVPAITGVDTDDLSFVWSYASRLFFVEKNTMNAWFLPVDNIAGIAASISMAGIFQEGGALMFGGKWSLDSGDGLDDKCVFVSTRGEVAVYEGADPTSSTDWRKVGLYKITPPMGINATMQAGGDLIIATEDGCVPLSEAVKKDIAALSLAAVTRSIGPEWRREVEVRKSLPWEIIKWSANNMMVVSLPVPDAGIDPYCFVANLETGSWCKLTGWDTRSLAVYSDQGYFGTSNGTIHAMDTGGSDDGSPYVCTYVGLPEHLDSPGTTKTIKMARSIFSTAVPFNAKVSASVNYAVNLPIPPSSAPNFTSDVWDVGLWDVAVWDAGTTMTVRTRWVSIGRTGFSVSPQIQVTSGTTLFPAIELIAYDVVFENGGVVV